MIRRDRTATTKSGNGPEIGSGIRSPRAARGGLGALLLALVVLCLPVGRAAAQGVPATCPATLGTADLIAHDFTVSFCELCDVGTVRIVVENPFRQSDDIDFSDLVVTEDLRDSGLTYVPGSTSFSGSNITVPPVVEPGVGGPAGSVLTWTLDPGFMMEAQPGFGGNRATLVIEFQVRRHFSVGEEDLVLDDRSIEATVELTPSCAPLARFSDSTGVGVLPLREPVPQVIKTGRNVDAGQGPGSYSDPVYAHENDDVIWRIEVRNSGQADLQDFVFSDSIVPGNFEIDWVCDSEGEASAAANGAAPAGCLAVGGTTDVVGLDVAAVFGGGANPYIVAPAGGSGFYYLVGRVTDSCTNRTNSVYDVEWGCQIEAPAGGIAATSTGVTAQDDALLSTRSDQNGLQVNVRLRGIDNSQPMGTKGLVTIRIRNNTGGTIKGGVGGLPIEDLLPEDYVIDPTFTPTIQMNPAYGNAYPGMIDTLEWTNPVAGTFPLTTSDPALPLGNRDLHFLLTSSTVHPDFPDQFNMIRHGDVVRIRFRTVLIDPQYYDRVANLDVRTEAPNSDPPGTDPPESFPISNELELRYEEFCTGTEHVVNDTENDVARPEDLDVDIGGSELIFILTSTGDPLPLTVNLRNDGGHDARDYQAYVTFGEAMVVQTAPAGCSPTTNPPALPPWREPADLPATASVYVCDRGVISPGETESLQFQVVKNTAPSFDDDLTFRADVIGEITLSDGTPLWFPTPTARADGITDRANDYTLDGIRARVIGYDLEKDQLGFCSENNPPVLDPDSEIQIGEECSFHIESGGWFGFQTPGFTYIAVQDIQVVDQLPDGQGYISSTDPLASSTPAIQGVSLNPPPVPLGEDDFDWTFNTVVPAERITEKDHWFRVDVTTRLLNDPLDTSAAPNEHAAQSSNVLTSTFEAVFFNPLTNAEELYNLGPDTVGYPREVHRRVDLTVTEPRLVVTKEVCNETRYGVGPACSNFVPLADDGDAFDTYVFRVTVENEASSGGVTRAPAYDVTVTSVADPSDQLFVDPLTGDVLDNDADGRIDAADAGGEGIITDNTVENGLPAQVIASYTHSADLLRIDAGERVELYYRVDPDDDVAPLQQLTNSATASYDSLEGASGDQSDPLGANGEIGGARQYVSAPGEATIQIIPVEVRPKQILRTANSALEPPPGPQPVSIGEEVEFGIQTLIPVARLRDFVIRDELPAGLRCTDAPVVDLDAPPYADAGFVPGGSFTPTCTDTEVVWDFGDQTVTRSPRVDRRFDFRVGFVARVDNVAANQEGLVIRNGGAATVTTVTYVDEVGNDIVIPIEEAAVVVREPVIELTKTFSVAEADAADTLRVTVNATNTGTATAYNLRVMDDLSAVDLDYIGDVQGANPPSVDLDLLGAEIPVFGWAPGFAIAPGETVGFSFAVRVTGLAEPLEVLENTIQADWTSLPDRDTALNPGGTIGPDGSPTGMRNGALPNAGDTLNDYESQAVASVTVPAATVAKVDLDPALAPEIGSHRSFEVVVALPEGTSRNVAVTDDLAAGSVSYVLADNADFDVSLEFSGIASINGQPPSEAAFTAVPADGSTGPTAWSIGTVVTESEDDLVTTAVDPSITIRYRARIDNDLATNAGSTLQNSARLDFSNGETGLTESDTSATAAVTATESALTATKVLTNVSPGKAAGDPPSFGDVLQYVVTVVNGGNAVAYDVNVVDTLPPELALYPGFTPTAAINGSAVAGFTGTPAGAPDGPLVWGRENGDESLDIPPGGFLELTYQVEVRLPPADGASIANNVWVDWTSLTSASPYERTGDGCPTIVPPNDYCFGPAVAEDTSEPLPPPGAVLKETTQATAAVGESFTYRLTVPSVPYGFPIYDVRLLDDLATSDADLGFVGVTRISGPGTWTPTNTGSATSLVIEDTATGIDIPAGERIEIEIEVVLLDTPTNVAGLEFTNSASYLYNLIDGNVDSQRPGDAGESGPMTIVEPDELVLDKSGPATMTVGTPATFTLLVDNPSGGSAWNPTVTDRLPDEADGGSCETPPTGVTAQLFEADGVTPASPVLVEDTHFTVDFAPAPTCTLAVSLLSAAPPIGSGQKLRITYDARLDGDSQDGATLTNVAGVTEWFSASGSATDRRTYTRTLSDGTVGDPDHEDAHTVTVAVPAFVFEKTVVDLTSGADPATTAEPGDVLRYRLRIENARDVPLQDFDITDEPGRLNDPGVFAAGSLSLVTVPAGADASGTDPSGGADGAGLLDVRNLDLPALGDEAIIEYEVTLAPVIPDATIVSNQARLRIDGTTLGDSDDPNVNGPDDPMVVGDEDPTRVAIVSAPEFRVEKISTDITDDPSVLLAGETLRYTITVKNVGTADATDAFLRDAVPVNTRYVAGSTTLNGSPVADGPGGLAPLSVGIPIHAPEDPTPGAMRADASATPSNVATLVFDVVVDEDVIDGTVVSNQAFVSAVAGGVSDQPSDDPGTPVPDDPTRDVVGNAPLLFASKEVSILTDGGTAGQVDPGDVLRYRITVLNSGAVPATGVTLRDDVPANTTYVADSVTLNGLPVGQPDGGASPLVPGIAISSSDLTPPLPGPGAGTLSPGVAAVVEFDLRVNAGVPAGTLISNQATVATTELPDLPTDGDGDPATGPEPTVVVVGDGQQVVITKQVATVGGGAALPGTTLEYVVRVTNVAAVAADAVMISDDLDDPVAGQLAYVAGSATLDGSPAGVSVAGSLITADYGATYGPLAPGATAVLRFQAVLDPGLAMGTTVTNTGVVSWGVPPQTASASVSVDVGGMPGVAALNGALWHDVDHDRVKDDDESTLEGWTVELTRNDRALQSVTTGPDGAYRFAGLSPNDTSADRYGIRFSAPRSGPRSASLGTAVSPFTNGPQEIRDIIAASGSNLQDLGLPIDPNGVVYGSLQRTPLSGVRLALLNAATGAAVPAGCFDDPVQQGQITRSDGFYKFDLNFSDPACPSGGDYVIQVRLAGSRNPTPTSTIIPPLSDVSSPPFAVPSCPGTPDDAVPSTTQHCESQPSALAPRISVQPDGGELGYHVHMTLDSSQTPGSSQIYNNHIAVDPDLDQSVAITKTTPSVNVSRGQLVPYEITVSNNLGVRLPNLGIVDRFPAGFKYVEKSAQIDGKPFEPEINGQELVWRNVGIGRTGQRTLVLLLAVGAGVSEGDFKNRAQAIDSETGTPLSGEASATVRVVPDPTFACTDVLGKVFDDADHDGFQDPGEKGLQGVRLTTVRGLVATTDQDGRFHITCAVTPRDDRGSNFMLKLDDRSLPSGYRMSTRTTQVKRATAGKALRFNFGASIHRVVGLDMADPVFEPGSTDMRPQWRTRIDLLLVELRKSPSILRLSYVADVEDEGLVEDRLDRVKKEIAEAWEEKDAYPLVIETEVYWRRGAPVDRPAPARPEVSTDDPGLPPVSAPPPGLEPDGPSLPAVSAGPPVRQADAGDATERSLPADAPLTQWTLDPETLSTESGDRIEQREVVAERARTVKLKDVVPPIRFGSGNADIPPSTVQTLRSVLDDMRDLRNVRLHLVGHADNQPLSGRLARIYGDNAGLSRERAGEVAEFLQAALGLAPESISFEFAGDTQPVASNATPEGRARNRRVEVEVWYDEVEQTVELEDFVVAEDFKRVKVCRMETVCKLRYLEGHAHRARVKNLIAPLHYGDDSVGVPPEFIEQIRQALHNLRTKTNVTIRFIGHTDDLPLTGRTERIYGTHLALSKARARRVALAVREALALPTSAVESDGRGASRPVASNDTARGRKLNQRIEVEFWHDDPLQELPDEPQLCPDASAAETVTRAYDPPWGRIEPVRIVDGRLEIPAGLTDALRRAMDDVADETNVRLRFIGYTGNERLDRRTALVYGDDIGLSTARARRTMETIRSDMGLAESQVEHEGHGYVHSKDVVNAGFVEDQSSYVEIQVVYDELAVLDDNEGVEVTRITRELSPADPLSLNLMRITVDGVPVDDPGRSSADIQRCTDVALDRADVQFKFDGLDVEPRLGVTVAPTTVRVRPPSDDSAEASPVLFRMYTNYPHFIDRSEVRIFELGRSLRSDPLAVVAIGEDGLARWQPAPESFEAPVRELEFVLRSYDAEGHFDETAPQRLWMVYGDGDVPAEDEAAASEALLAGYGEGEPVARNIPLGDAGTVRVQGSGIPGRHDVYVAGTPVPVDAQGRFVAEALIPSGLHTVEVAVLDEQGNGELFLRDLEMDRSEWFYMGIADLTLSANRTRGPADELEGKNAPYDYDTGADGRLAFYLNGKFGDGWKLTASADTREDEVTDLFTNFLDKSPEALFRRIDPDYHYPTFGDDSTVEETAPTSGKLYAKLQKDESHALWGNFKIGYLDNELAQVDRGLYGANLHYQTLAATEAGEQRLVVDGFAAKPGTVSSREEFRGTGGSLYFLRRQDVLEGSERLRIEIRDKDSGLVTGVVHLRPNLDYDIDYIQGRILLAEPVSATVDDGLLVRSQGLDGNEAWLVVQYEYSPEFDDLDAMTFGGQGSLWLTDFLKVGVTASRDDEGGNSTLYGADVTLRKSTDTWFKVQAGRSEGVVSTSQLSNDGGFQFVGVQTPLLVDTDANAYRADLSFGFGDLFDDAPGRISLYAQRLEDGYSAPGLTALTRIDQAGGTFEMSLLDALHLTAKADKTMQEDALETTSGELDVAYDLTEHWNLSSGVRYDDRDDDSPIVPLTQEEGERADAVVQLGFDSKGRWSSYGFGQTTLLKSGDRESNTRYGLGGAFRLTDRIALEGEVSHGDLGPAVQAGLSYQQSEHTRRYLTYSLDNERGYDGLHRRTGTLVSGMRSRLADSGSVYQESRYQTTDDSTGLTRSMGFSYAPTDRWSLGANWEYGTLIDRQTMAETDRNAGGGSVAYGNDWLQVSTGVEYRFDKAEQPDGSHTDRTTWLFRNNFRVQVTPDGRVVGKFNHSFSDSSEGQFYDGEFTEAVVGFAYRPVQHDRLNVLTKYTYFYNMPGADQVTLENTSARFIQRSHIASIDVSYDVTRFLTLGAKYAYRRGEVSLDRENPDFFRNDAHLYILRGDLRFLENWEASVEGRMLDLPDLDERRSGALVTLYRYLGKHFKVGVGYNFTDFSDDLTDLDYDNHGWFLNLVGTL